MLQVNNVLQAVQEPHVYLCKLLYSLHGKALLQRLCNGEDAQVGRIGKFFLQVVELGMVVAHKAVHTLPYHAQALLNHFLERPANGHYLAHRLH